MKSVQHETWGTVETKQTYRFYCKPAKGSIVNVMSFLNIPHTV